MTSSQLLAICDRFSAKKVSIIGDLMLDEYTWGSVDRISPEAPVVVVKVTEDSHRAGGAGNVAANVAELGGVARIVGFVGNDQAGEKLTSKLESRGVDTSLLVRSDQRPTITKTRVIAHGQQVVRVDREEGKAFDSTFNDQLVANLRSVWEDSDVIVVSDYGKGVWNKQLFEAFQELSKNSKSGKDIKTVIDPKPKQIGFYKGAWIMTPNRKEAEEISGMVIEDRESAIEAGRKIIEDIEVEKVLVTLGAKGMVLVDREQGCLGAIDTVAQKVFDVSGAGDTVCATLALGIACEEDALSAARLANIAAGVVVGEVGTVAVTSEKLRAAIASRQFFN
jgi:D-beta-D-heptose 7-phosphate kinase/D-beta-D-heptose 1-phosphate adenosyltransferase